MKRKILLPIMALLILTGCSSISNHDRLTLLSAKKEASEPIIETGSEAVNTAVHPTDIMKQDAVTIMEDGGLHFELSSASSVLIKSIPDSQGVTITDLDFVQSLTGMISDFTPRNTGNDDQSEYDYTLTFYDSDGTELTTFQVLNNFIISYQGKLYIDQSNQLYLWDIRKEYIEKVKSSLAVDKTSFTLNGKVIQLQDLDTGINAITDYSWLGYEEYPEPTLFLECHINPKVGYCAVFDAEKMDFVFGSHGTSFTYHNYSATSLVYTLQDEVYNYWGDSLYQNQDDSYYISNLEYDTNSSNNAVIVTLASYDEEKHIKVSCLNYHNNFEDSGNAADTFTPLAEFQSDLTHDGVFESIHIYKAEDAGDLAKLEIKAADGTVMRSEYAHTSHAGWNSIYLCRQDNKDYLLYFNPYQCTGTADFVFVLYDLTERNTIEIVDSGSYSFSYGAAEGTADGFHEEVFRSFADKVNSYLEDSYLLMSTEGGELNYSTKDHLVLASEQYKTDRWTKDIKSNLY
jgi:hypothetical protein